MRGDIDTIKTKKAVADSGLHLDEIASLCECHRNTAWRIINGKNQPNSGLFLRFAVAIGYGHKPFELTIQEDD